MKEKKAKMQEEMMEKISQMGEEAPELPKEMRSEMTSRSNSFDSQDLWDPYNEEEQIGVEQELYNKIKKKIDLKSTHGPKSKKSKT